MKFAIAFFGTAMLLAGCTGSSTTETPVPVAPVVRVSQTAEQVKTWKDLQNRLAELDLIKNELARKSAEEERAWDAWGKSHSTADYAALEVKRAEKAAIERRISAKQGEIVRLQRKLQSDE